MKSVLIAISLLGLGLQGLLHAAEPNSELNEELAIRLIADVLDIKATGIKVASVIEGEKRSEDGFVERQMRRVTVVQQILENGRMVRRVRCYDFSWNPRYGWFYQKIGSSRSGEEVMIWSEREGELIVK
ncbi:MAG: hypothetical protein ACSHX9_03315 [Luteolibacter sp.]